MMGYSPQEIRELTWVDLTYPADLVENLRLFSSAISDGADSYMMKKRFVRKDGSLLHADIQVMIVRDPAGIPDYNILLVRDISARIKAEEDMQRLLRNREHEVEARTSKLRDSERRL